MKVSIVVAVSLASAVVVASPAQAHVTKLRATLSGTEAVPSPGDADGYGSIELRVNPHTGTVCEVLRVRAVPDSEIANIRFGRRGKAGQIVIDLDILGMVTRSCTTSVPTGDLLEMGQFPARFYANVTSDAHPRGALRGQLERVATTTSRSTSWAASFVRPST
jgi:hypothetical protein